MLGRSCDETIAIDVSEDAVTRIRQNAARNGVAVDARVGNVFDELRGLDRLGERFDTIVLDPPAFAKNKAAVSNARAGYKEINLRALKLLNPGGTLITCSCSYHVNEAAFAEIVYEAAVDAQVHVTVVEKRMQGRDHPVLLGVPETYYLKCFILQKTRVNADCRPQRRPRARRALKQMARPAGDFDASRYFRGAGDLGFYNVGTSAMRGLAQVDSRGASRTLDRGRRARVCRDANRGSPSRGEVGRYRGAGAVPA